MPVKNFNTTIAKTFHDRMNVRDGVFIDNELSQSKAVPVIEIDKPIANIVKRASAVNATSATIFTTPTDKDFYLTSATLSFIKDASSDSTASYIQTTIDGTATQVLHLVQLASTAQQGSIACSFPAPIKVDRGVAISVFNITATANASASGCISGYISDTLRY